MHQFSCPYLKGIVVLTDEREQHIRARHPDLLPSAIESLAHTIENPDEVRASSWDDSETFVQWIATIRGGRYLIAIVRTDASEPPRHWITTAYLSRRLPPE